MKETNLHANAQKIDGSPAWTSLVLVCASMTPLLRSILPLFYGSPGVEVSVDIFSSFVDETMLGPPSVYMSSM